MPKFAANLSFIFQEIGFLDRFAAAAQCGFKAVEYLGAYDHPPETVAAHLRTTVSSRRLFNMPPGNWAAGERGMAALPGREAEFRAGVEQALIYAKATNCRLLHAMAGLWPEGRDRAEALRVYAANLRYAAERLAPEGITVIIEPINNRDIPGYFLNTTSQAMAVIEQVGRPNLQLQLDLYHVQIMEGDLAHHIRDPGRPLPAYPDRRQSRPARARYRRDQLPVPVRSARTRSAMPAGSAASTGRRAKLGPGSAGPSATAFEARAMRIVITGGCGFLGRRLAVLLLSGAAASARSTSWYCSTMRHRRCPCPMTSGSGLRSAISPIAKPYGSC